MVGCNYQFNRPIVATYPVYQWLSVSPSQHLEAYSRGQVA